MTDRAALVLADGQLEQLQVGDRLVDSGGNVFIYAGLAGALTLAMFPTQAQGTILGRASGAGTGTPTALSVSQVAAITGGFSTNTLAKGNDGRLAMHQACDMVATENVDVTNPSASFPMNGVAFLLLSRVLLTNQTTPAEDGVYTTGITSSTALTRATDWNAAGSVRGGDMVPISGFDSSNELAGSVWYVKRSAASTITVGTTDPVMTQLIPKALSGSPHDALYAIQPVGYGNIDIASPGTTFGDVVYSPLSDPARLGLFDQTDPIENGIWMWTDGTTALYRPADYLTGSEAGENPVTYNGLNGTDSYSGVPLTYVPRRSNAVVGTTDAGWCEAYSIRGLPVQSQVTAFKYRQTLRSTDLSVFYGTLNITAGSLTIQSGGQLILLRTPNGT